MGTPGAGASRKTRQNKLAGQVLGEGDADIRRQVWPSQDRANINEEVARPTCWGLVGEMVEAGSVTGSRASHTQQHLVLVTHCAI